MTNRYPDSWSQLQDLVAKYFNESGYTATTERTVDTVRGKVEFDVFVETPNELANSMVCECKYWSTAIPQEKIHAFCTVVSDSGISLGYIISKSGFQSGAHNAADKSNIRLLTWSEFLDSIFDKWFAFRKRRLLLMAKPLAVYTDCLDVPIDKLNKLQLEEYKRTLNRSCSLWIYYCRTINDESISKYNQEHNCAITSYEEYFDILEENVIEVINYYRKLYCHCEIPGWKFAF